MTPISVKRNLQTVSCPASPTVNTFTVKTIPYDVVYTTPGAINDNTLMIGDFFTNIQSTCTTFECTYTFKDSSGNVMAIPKYIGTVGLNLDTVPSNLSGDWVGFISCRTDS